MYYFRFETIYDRYFPGDFDALGKVYSNLCIKLNANFSTTADDNDHDNPLSRCLSMLVLLELYVTIVTMWIEVGGVKSRVDRLLQLNFYAMLHAIWFFSFSFIVW